jgi:hypothetical protein
MSFEEIKDRDDAIAFWNDIQQKEIDDLASELSDAIGEFGMELFVTTRLRGKLSSMGTIAKLFGDDKFQDWIGDVREELCRRVAEADIAEKYKP